MYGWMDVWMDRWVGDSFYFLCLLLHWENDAGWFEGSKINVILTQHSYAGVIIGISVREIHTFYIWMFFCYSRFQSLFFMRTPALFTLKYQVRTTKHL